MPNPPSKGAEETPAHPRVTTAKTHHTHSTAAALDNNANPTQGNKASSSQVNLDPTTSSSLLYVAQAINEVIAKCKISSQAKLLLEITKYIRSEKKKPGTSHKKLPAGRTRAGIETRVVPITSHFRPQGRFHELIHIYVYTP